MEQRISFLECRWLNEPNDKIVKEKSMIVSTNPHTGLWNQTYYNTVHNSAPILYFENEEDMTLTVRVDFKHKKKYDQSGMVVYITPDCWFKLCVEYIDDVASKVMTVVTQNGFSDQSSMNISSQIHFMYFRIHHRNFTFLAQNSFNGIHYKDMRLFHLDPLGQRLKMGVFAASPHNSSFDAKFSEFVKDECQWETYEGEAQ